RARDAAPRRGRADDDDVAPPRALHRWDHLARGEEGAERVGAEARLEVRGRDLLDGAEDARARVVDEDRNLALFGADRREGLRDGRRVGDVAGVGAPPGERRRELLRELGPAREERPRAPLRREAPREGRAVPRPDTDHRAHAPPALPAHRDPPRRETPTVDARPVAAILARDGESM